ncbi:alpha/beta hydrolase [Streptomyces sp. 5-10]|nr:alpha/beta hydrolase [Streptomyces sp. 5-6(2022)]MBD3009018.1 alpha/beta hydrolase [Streptomyces sp. 5-10]
MPRIPTNGIHLSYEREGEGDPVLFIMGTSAGGQVWTTHQTPALIKSGYHCVTFNNRGVPPSDAPPGKYSLASMVADTKGLIEALGLGPCHIVGNSLGALIAQELLIGHRELVRSAVLIATKARQDPVRQALARGEQTLIEGGIRVTPHYEAAMTAIQMLSPATLNNATAAATWLELFELSAETKERVHGQSWADLSSDRREALRSVTTPCRVITFTDDLITPPYLGAEVSDAIPDCDLVEISRCGHFGFLERPAETNTAIIEFLDKSRT